MILNGKRVDLPQLQAEFATAGIVAAGLGTTGDDLHTYDQTGEAIDLPAGAAAVVAAHVPPLPVVGYAGSAEVSARVRTTDATPLTVFRATLPTNTGYRAKLYVLAVDAGNGAVRSIEASIVAKRLGAGAVLVGAPVVIANHQDAAASTWAIAAAVSGNDVVVTATGAAGRTIDWLLTGSAIRFGPGGLGG